MRPPRALVALLLLVAPVTAGLAAGATAAPASAATSTVFPGPVPEATCGAGSRPETGVQGEVPLKDRQSGRSQKGYQCNLELLGQYQGQGTTWVSQSYGSCAYHAQTVTSVTSSTSGVQVVDVRDPAHPRLEGLLRSPAFLGNTWESLKVNTARKLLAGVQVGPVLGAAFFDVYDISDCHHPKLLNSVASTQLSIPSNLLGHEGNWSPDGKTYWSTSLIGGQITAIDVADPTAPRILYTNGTGASNHGLSLSRDGRRLYLANTDPNGLVVLDVSEVQDRVADPQVHEVGHVFWTDGATGQHSIPLSYGGKPYVLFVDELGSGAARIIDISDETKPRIVSKLKLQIQMPSAEALRAKSAGSGTFGYDGHYCDVDRQTDPTAVACGYFESGVRVFDIRVPTSPREVAYFNPPAQVGKKALLTGSEHANGAIAEEDMTADWCSSPPRFVGRDQLWVTCQDNGFMVLRFTNAAYPIRAAARPTTAGGTKGAAAAPAGSRAPSGSSSSAPVASGSRPGGSLPTTGAVGGTALLGLLLVSVAAVLGRRRRAPLR